MTSSARIHIADPNSELLDARFKEWVDWDQDLKSSLALAPPLFNGADPSAEALGSPPFTAYGALQLDLHSQIPDAATVTGYGFDLSSFLQMSIPEASLPPLDATTPQLTPDTDPPELPPSSQEAALNNLFCNEVISWVVQYELMHAQSSGPLASYPETPASNLSASSPLTVDDASSEDIADMDVDDSDSNDSSSGSEYQPSEYTSSPRLPPLTQRAAAKNARASTSRPKSSRTPSCRPGPSCRARPLRRAPRKQAKSAKSAKHSKAGKSRVRQFPLDHPCPTPVDFTCPLCGWRQRNRRTPDLMRHIASHYAEARGGDWVCCGLPLAEARARGIVDMRDAQMCAYTGMVMVGGCGIAFTRKDAYKRHLGGGKSRRCRGDVDGSWVPGIIRARQY